MKDIMRFYVLLGCLFFNIAIFSQESDFDKGVRAYHGEDYSKAVEFFENVLRQGQYSSALYFNLGNAYYNNDELGKAILNYERALKVEPGNTLARQTLEQVNTEIKIQITAIPDFILWRGYRWGLTLFSSGTWAKLQLIAGLFFIFTLYKLWFNPFDKKWVSWGFPGLALVLVFGMWWCAAQKKYIETGQEGAIVMAEEAFLYKSPDDRSETIADLSEGVKVFLIDRIGDWLKVQLLDKDVGWIEIKKVEII